MKHDSARELCQQHDYLSNGPVLIGPGGSHCSQMGRDIRMGPAVCCNCGHVAVDVPARPFGLTQ